MTCSLVEICLLEEDAAFIFKLLTLRMEEAHASKASENSYYTNSATY